MSIRSLGFIGLGVMGAPQSLNLRRKSELAMTVFDVNPHNAEPLVDAGATLATSIAELTAASDLIFLSLPGGPEVSSVLYDDSGVLAHAKAATIVVDLSTSPVTLARQAALQCAERDVEFVDAPVARTRQAAVDGTLSIMVGCSGQQTFTAVEPFLRMMATDVTYCGRPGSGALLKLLNNMVVFETVVALAEAVTVARRSGLIDDRLLFDVLGKGSAASFTLENHGRKALLPDTHPTGAFSAAYMRKDIGYALDLAAELGVDLPAASLAHSLLGTVCQSGLAGAYHTAVVRVIEGQIP